MRGMLRGMGGPAAVVGMVCLLLVVPGLVPAAPPPVEAFFGAPEIGSVTLSPSGKTLAMTVPGKNRRMELVVADLERAPLQFKSIAWLTDYDIAGAIWLNERRLVFEAYDSQAGEWAGITGLWAVDADGQNARMLVDPYWAGFRAVQTADRTILPADWGFFGLPGDGSDDVLIERYGWSTWRGAGESDLARISTHAPRLNILTKGAPDGAQRWITDASGTPQVVVSVLDGQRRIHRRAGDGTWQQLGTFDLLSNAGWSPRFLIGDELLVAGEAPGTPGAQLLLFDPAQGGVQPQPVLAGKGFDVGASAWPRLDAPGGRFLGWQYRLDTIYTRWADPTMAAAQAAIDKALPGHVNLIECQPCLDAPRWLVTSLSDRAPRRWFLFERASGKMTSLGSALPDAADAEPFARRFQRIRARDGRDLPVYVTRPLQAQGAQPAVLYIHRGPESRVSLEWSWDAVPAFLASRGYTVIEPEFRGSAGYGRAHELAGRGQWGRAMQDDMHDALHWAVAQGLVDAGRVCIMGASYGGYAALIGPVREPAAFRCAISWVAPTDLEALLVDWRDQAGLNKTRARLIEDRLGPAAALREVSPVNRAKDLKLPVLAAFGVTDQRIPIATHGRSFRDAARAAGVDLDYVEYPEEGHVWMKPQTRIDFFGRVDKLLARTIGRR